MARTPFEVEQDRLIARVAELEKALILATTIIDRYRDEVEADNKDNPLEVRTNRELKLIRAALAKS